MAEMYIDEATGEPVVVAAHQEMFRGLALSCWHSIGSSMAVLASGEARDSLTPIQDVAATYANCRIELNKFKDHIKDAPPQVTSDQFNKALLLVMTSFEEFLVVDDVQMDRPDHENDPRVITFIKGLMLFLDYLWEVMEFTSSRRAKKHAREFSEAMKEMREGTDG